MNLPAIGHNRTPFELIQEKIEGLYEEAKQYLDGAAIESQGQADDLGNLLRMIQAAEKEAEALRKEENKPFDDGKKEVQARYNELIGDTKAKKGLTVLAKDIIKQALQPWLDKLDAEKREAERKAAEEAEQARQAALAKLEASREAPDLSVREEAEELLSDAREAEKAAKSAERDRARAGGIGRAVGMRSVWKADLVSLNDAVTHYYERDSAALAQLVTQLANRDVRNGARDIPGFEITETKTPV